LAFADATLDFGDLVIMGDRVDVRLWMKGRVRRERTSVAAGELELDGMAAEAAELY
jgi:hypothetical protein